MNFSTNDSVRYLQLLGRNLLRDAWYPSLGIAIAHALLDAESSVMDCLAAGAITLSLIVAAATFSGRDSGGASVREYRPWRSLGSGTT